MNQRPVTQGTGIEKGYMSFDQPTTDLGRPMTTSVAGRSRPKQQTNSNPHLHAATT